MVLGRAGAGKSVLALQFSKSLAEKRSRDRQGPVPVIFSLGSWNPVTTTLRNWLIGRLERDYSFLAAPGPGPEDTTWATELLDGGNYVLPILDGFDEIAADDGMREEAVKQFNSSTLSLVVTSRPEAINNVRDDSRIRPSAAAIELADLGLDDSLRYLREATATPRDDGTGDVGRLGWRYVLRELSLRPHTRASHDLATVLATPLMTTLARFAYESRVPGHDPSDLLNTEKFSTQDALEEHLLDFFVRTAYKRLLGSRPTSGAKGRPEEPRWGVERPRHWLGYLAVHLTKLGTSDIEWWRLGTAMKLRWVALRVGVTVGIACGLVSGLAYGASTAVGYGLLNGVLAAVITGVTNGTAMGLTFGLMQGFVTKMKVGGPIFEPSRVEIRMHSWTDTETRTRLRKNFLPRTRGGTAGGVLFGLLWAVGVTAVNVSMGNSWGVVVPFAGLLLATATGLGLVLGLIAALGAGFETVIPRKELDSPSDLLITNRATVLKQIITVGLVTGSGYGTLYGLTANSSLSGVWIGLVAGVMVSLGVGTMTAWGRSVVLARIWLPMAGQLPTDLDTFLQDAYARGVLRREGVVYQFRHARLQEYLSNAHQR
ncbi:NACHT domain-containing protein [Streptomyces sp. RTGN2]|uniref:NACHT domain-containing protein n=1 Tax=Streptomyces sp. RTGN2 TaxID=3016525 RepID=UPI0025575A91|nr:NACHT domain-containing protein [Streptomyces sp. RTGN2]